MIKEAIIKVAKKEDLTYEESKAVMRSWMEKLLRYRRRHI